MTPNQIELVKQSFEKLKPVAQAAGELFYANLFEIVPQARAMFRTPLPEQAGKLMYTLGYVVNHLHHPDTIMEEVKKLAARHVQYGARPEHYTMVGEALLKTLQQGLGSSWNENLEEAWTAAYSLVAGAMIAASAGQEKQAA